MNLKDTIFLPKTDFQMRGNLAARESDILEYWKSQDVYNKSNEKNSEGRKFVLHDGPPFANGKPHVGHALNKCIKDIITRMKRMQGFQVNFIPGWDCHGLPIEWKIEEQLIAEKKKRSEIPVPEFRDMCQKFAMNWIKVQNEGFQQLGICADWEHPYLTMNPASEATVIRMIGKFIIDGSLYRGEKPVFWSVVEKTALADAEIEYMDKKSESIYVAFKFKSVKNDALKDAYCVIWTTTPWTIPANRAISYSTDENEIYILLRWNDKKLLIAKKLFSEFVKSSGLKNELKLIEGEFSGKDLQGAICSHPFAGQGYDFDVPLIQGDHVDLSTGTGFVHTAPGHGLDDFYVCQKYGIPTPQTVNESGIYYDSVPMFAGQHIFKAEKVVIEKLTEVGSLVAHTTIVHSYPHSWRSKSPLIFRTTPQWFISMDKNGLREKALQEIEKTKWIPSQGHNRIQAFVAKRSDWCISRQRVWGVPIPLFINKKTGELLRDEEVVERVAQIFEKEGANAWFIRPAQDFLGDKYKASDYDQNFDTLDVWFESASTNAYVLQPNEDGDRRADLYVEGSDQHRGWFQHSLLVSCEAYGEAPFKAVMTHGFLVDEQGRKMSKSLGNTVNLEDVVKKYGTDVLRLWVACSDFTQDLKIGPNLLKQMEDVYRKIRNVLRYMIGASTSLTVEQIVEYSEMPLLEKWVLHRVTEIQEELQNSIENYDISRYFYTIYNFLAGDLSQIYFDIRKDCLYCDDADDITRRAYQTVVWKVFTISVKWLAPILVYTSEDAWQVFSKETQTGYGQGSIHLERYSKFDIEKWKCPEIAQGFENVKKVRHVINTALENARRDKLIGSSLQAKVQLFVSKKDFLYNESDIEFWKEVSITSQFEISYGEAPADAFTSDEVPEIKVKVTLAEGSKCERCWKITEVNEDGICKRCQEVLKKLS